MNSKRHAVITKPNTTEPFTLHAVFDSMEFNQGGYVFDPTEYLDSVVVINFMVAGGSRVDVFLVDKTDELPLGFHFHVMILGDPSAYIDSGFVTQDGKYHFANDTGDYYFRPSSLSFNSLWRVTLIQDRINQRREWIFTRVIEGDSCTGDVH